MPTTLRASPPTTLTPLGLRALEERINIPKPGALPTFGEKALAAFEQENTLFSLVLYANDRSDRSFLPDDPTYNPYDNDVQGQYLDYADLFSDSRSHAQSAIIKRRIDRELRNRRILADAGFTGFALNFAAALLGPENLIPVGQAVTAFRTGSTIGKAALRGAVAGGIGAGLSEAALLPTQETRTLGESTLNIVTGITFGAVLGSAAGALSTTERRIISDELRDVLSGEKDVGDLVPKEVVEQLSKNHTEEELLRMSDQKRLTAVRKAFVDSGVLTQSTADLPWVGRGLAKLTGSVYSRLALSPSPVTRMVARTLSKVPILWHGEPLKTGAPLEIAAIGWEVGAFGVRGQWDSVYDAYKVSARAGDEPPISIDDWNTDLSRALRTGDKHIGEFKGEVHAESIAKAASIGRKFLKRLEDELISWGYLSHRFDSETAESYWHRMYDSKRIDDLRFQKQQGLVEEDFEDAVTRWLIEDDDTLNPKDARRVAQEMIADLQGRKSGRYVFHGDLDATLSRRLLINDEELDALGVLVNDPHLTIAKLAQNVGTRLETSKMYRTFTDDIFHVVQERRDKLAKKLKRHDTGALDERTYNEILDLQEDIYNLEAARILSLEPGAEYIDDVELLLERVQEYPEIRNRYRSTLPGERKYQRARKALAAARRREKAARNSSAHVEAFERLESAHAELEGRKKDHAAFQKAETAYKNMRKILRDTRKRAVDLTKNDPRAGIFDNLESGPVRRMNRARFKLTEVELEGVTPERLREFTADDGNIKITEYREEGWPKKKTRWRVKAENRFGKHVFEADNLTFNEARQHTRRISRDAARDLTDTAMDMAHRWRKRVALDGDSGVGIERMISSDFQELIDDAAASGNVKKATKLTSQQDAKKAAELARQRGAKKAAKLTRQRDAAIDDFRHALRFIQHRSMSDSDPTTAMHRVVGGVMKINFLSKGGGFAWSSIPDLGNIVFVNGFKGALRAIYSVVRNPALFKGVKLRELHAMEMVGHSKVLDWMELTSTNGGDSTLERILEFMATGGNVGTRRVPGFSKLNLMDPWNAYSSMTSSISAGDRMLREIAKVVRGTASKKTRQLLEQAGIDEEMAHRIFRSWNNVPERLRQDGKVLLPVLEQWDDPVAARAFNQANLWDVHRTIFRVGATERPRWMSHPVFRIIGQFRSFGFVATHNLILSGLSRRDAMVLSGSLATIAFGGVVTAGYSAVTGRDLGGPAKFALDAVDRSGLAGIFADYHNIVERTTGVGLHTAFTDTKQGATRYQSRNKLDAVLGPTLGAASDLLSIPGIITDHRDIRRGDIKTMRRLLPYQNLIYIRSLLDKFQEGVTSWVVPEEAQ